MRVVLLADRVPIPPLDGDMLPAAAYVQGLLARGHQVDLCHLRWRPDEVAVDFGPAETVFGRVVCLKARRRGLPARALDELTRRDPAFLVPELGAEERRRLDAFLQGADAVLVWPRTMAGVARRWLDLEPKPRPRVVFLVWDFWALTLAKRRYGFGAVSPGQRLKEWLAGLRARWLARLEARALSVADRVVVQTDVEAEWARALPGSLGARVSVLSNGVHPELFSLPLEGRPSGIVGFVGRLNEFYGQRVRDFLRDVWPQVSAAEAGLRFKIVGRDPDVELRAFFQAPDVEHVPFEARLVDVYRDMEFLVAPIFKGFGVINKVLEAMAAGTVVVGDATAFHAIPGFEHGRHGIVADTPAEMARALVALSRDPVRVRRIREEARALMRREFAWEDRVRVLEALLESRDR